MDTSRRSFWDIETQAMRWLVRLDKGRSPELAAQHEAWLALSPRHQVAHTKQLLAWRRMDVLKQKRPLDYERWADPDLMKRPVMWPGVAGLLTALVGAGWGPKVAFGAAATILLMILAVALLQPKSEILLVTGVGQQRHALLEDGTQLTLNTDSKLRVRFTAERRQLFLDRGEVLLAVAHDASRPLEVVAGNVTSRAVGTKFSVRLIEAEARVETLVTEGRVLVLRQSHLFGIPLEPKAVTHTLEAGEKVIVRQREVEVQRLTRKQTQRQLMWTTGKIAFDSEKLSDVVREVNRYNQRPLVILDPAISNTPIGGAFNTSNADVYAQDLVEFFGDQKLKAVKRSGDR